MADTANKNKPDAKQRASRLMDALMSGTLSPEVEERIRVWFRKPGNPAGKMAAMEASFHAEMSEVRNPAPEDYEAFRDLSRKLDLPQTPVVKRMPVRRKISWTRRIAAVLVPLAVVLGTAFWLMNKPQPVADITVTASAGVQEKVSLPDGSVVWLNPDGQITYPEKFGQTRSITLTGEAFFQVARDEQHPFHVHSGELTVTVLGTEFMVRANPGEQRSTVTLHSGAVQVEAGENQNQLQPGERLAYYHQTGETELHEVELEDWTKPSMDFYYQPLAEIFRSIELNYNVRIEVEGEFSETPYTLHFIRKEGLEDVLRKLQGLTREFTYHIDNDKIRITTND